MIRKPQTLMIEEMIILVLEKCVEIFSVILQRSVLCLSRYLALFLHIIAFNVSFYSGELGNVQIPSPITSFHVA